MSRIFKFRVLLNAPDDVFRDIEIRGESNLEHLHNAIVSAFGLEEGEMSAFYQSDEQWNQGEEIPLVDMGMTGTKQKLMNEFPINSIFHKDHRWLIFVYDFLNMWSFFVEFISEEEEVQKREYPFVSLTFGETPSEVPAPEFEEDGLFSNAFDDDDDDFNEEAFDDGYDD